MSWVDYVTVQIGYNELPKWEVKEFKELLKSILRTKDKFMLGINNSKKLGYKYWKRGERKCK